MTSLKFPKMFQSNNTKTVSGKEASMQNFKLILQSKIGEFFGDPEYGSTIVKNLYTFNDTILVDILKDQIYTMTCNYMPQLTIGRNDIIITRDATTMYISIYALNDETKQVELIDFNLQV